MGRPKKRIGQKNAATAVAKKRDRKRLPSWRAALVMVVLIGLSGAGLASYKRSHEIAHDLSVIGNGLPTVVQVHDPGCPKCQQLKRNVDAASRTFESDIQFRIAQIKTERGRRFANQHRVPHVTLVFFDPDGKRVRTIEGITSPDILERAFSRLAGRRTDR